MRCEVVLIYLNIAKKLNFEDELFYDLVWPGVVDAAKGPFSVTSKKGVGVVISLFNELLFTSYKHLELIYKQSLSPIGVFFSLFLLGFILLANHFLDVIKHFFMDKRPVEVDVGLLDAFASFF